MAIKTETFTGGGGGGGGAVDSVNGDTGNVIVTLDGVTDQNAVTTNSVTVGGVTVGTEYSLPTADGTTGQAITTDGNGALSFSTVSSAVTSVNTLTGAVVVSGDDLAADHTASNYTAANANIDGHLSGIDTKLGTLTTGLTYKGSFNATTGAPSIANTLQGDLYIISVAGTIYGQTWAVGDHLLINADMGGTVTNSKIDKIDNTDQVTSVNTQTGAIVLSGNDLVADHSASNYTAANANIDGHLSGIDTKFGTLGTASVEDVGTTAGDLVQLDGTAKLPAVDGSQLTNLPSAPVTSVNTLTGAVVVSGDDIAADHSASNYTATNANIDGHLSGIDTKFGTLGTASTQDVGTTANDVVQLDGAAKLPAIDGSQLTNLPSAPVTSVNTLTGAVVVSGDDVAADHTASNYTAANANIDGHLSGIDTKFGTLGSAAVADVGTTAGDLVHLDGAAKLPAIDGSQLTNLPSAPVTSVNTLTGAVVVSGDDIAADHSASNYTAANANIDGHLSGIDTKFGTLGTASTQDVGTTANDVVQLDGTAKLPAVDGSQLTNLPSAPVTSVNTLTGAVVVSGNDLVADHSASNYTAANANIDGHLSGIDTKFGTLGTAAVEDVGTTAGDLVQLDGAAKLPAIDGSQLTNLPSAPVTSVNTLTGAVVVSGNDLVADHTAVNYTAANANVDGHLSGIDTKFGTLGTASTASTSDFLASTAGLDDLSNVAYTAGAGIDNYVLTYDHASTSWGAEASGSAPVTSVNTLTGAVVVSGDDIAADHTASNYTATNANIDGHLSGIDTKFGTLGTAAVQDVGTTANDVVQLDGTAKLPAVDGSQLTNLPSAPVTSVNTLTGAVVVSGNDIAADHTASNYTATNANIDGHLSGIDTKFGTLGTASTAATTDFLASTAGLDDLSDVAYTAGAGIDNYVLTYDHASTSWGAEAAASGGLSEVVQDTTPQLGGSLDVNGQDIVSVSNGDIEVDPNGTGSFKIRGNATSGSGRLVLNCEQNTHGITLKGPPHSAAASYTLTFPNTDGTANQVLKTDGSGGLDWVDQASGGGGGWTYSAITADPSNAQASYHYSCTGTFSITLPTSGVSAGAEIRVKNMGTGTITIDPQTQTIDGSTTDYVMDVQYSAITLVSTGTNWEII